MFGRAVFATGTRKALFAPASAVTSQGQLQSVFVVEGGSARSRLVTLGERAGDSVEVLSGINAGEIVVTAPPANLIDGAKVEVQR
jgi:membrane fusion protein (multidrug efflux system)